MIAKPILDLIGNTPLVKIQHLNPNKNVDILAKLEGFNPTGSIKDRIALKMVKEAEQNGKLAKGQTIIEPTSGNTGISLAMVGIIRGYDVEIVMSSAVSIERQKMIKAFGAKVTLTEAEKGTDGAIMKARELVKENPDKYHMPDQFSNKCNYVAHYESTAQEIIDQVGYVDYFVSAIGTSGTLMGVGLGLKEINSNVKIVCAQPTCGHYIQGLKNMNEAIVPSIYKPELIDEQIMINSEEAFEMSRQIVKKEGIFVGMSAGAAMLASIEVAKKIDKGRMVVIFADRGEKYLSTNLFKV